VSRSEADVGVVGVFSKIDLRPVETGRIDVFDSKCDALVDQVQHTQGHVGAASDFRQSGSFGQHEVREHEPAPLAGQCDRDIAGGAVMRVFLVDQCVET
jgi:hypothetical protein